MIKSYSRFYFVYVLSARAAAAKCVPADIGSIDLNIYVVIHHWIYIHRSKGSMAAVRRIERGEANQTVNAIFAFQVSESMVAFDLDGNRFNANPISII